MIHRMRSTEIMHQAKIRGSALKDAAKEQSWTPPSTWLLLGDKLGDNAQVDRVMEELTWSHTVRRLVFLERYRFGKPTFKASLFHVDLDASDSLEAPWPDLIVTVGRRPAMVAQWIKNQSKGLTKVVLFGRPKRNIGSFDLVVAPSQYRLPTRDNVHEIKLPLMRVDPERLEVARRHWEDQFRSYARPIIAMLVGGPTKPFGLGAKDAKVLAEKALDLATTSGGSLYLTTSRRTPLEVVDVLCQELAGKAQIHRFDANSAENPYLALLALADRFIVTGDSVSMMVEVASLGKPLAIYELPLKRGLMPWLQKAGLNLFHRQGAPLSWVARWLQSWGIWGYPRDLTAIHRRLYQCRAAKPLGRGFPSDSAMIENEVAVVAQRIRGLVQT